MDCFGRDDIGKLEKLCNKEGRKGGGRVKRGYGRDGVVKRALHRNQFRHIHHKRTFLTVV